MFDLEGDFVDENTIAVNIRRLREKIEDNPAAPVYIKEYQRSWVYMESGGKAVTKRYRKEDYSSALLGITCHIIVCNIKLLYHVCVL